MRRFAPPSIPAYVLAHLVDDGDNYTAELIRDRSSTQLHV